MYLEDSVNLVKSKQKKRFGVKTKPHPPAYQPPAAKLDDRIFPYINKLEKEKEIWFKDFLEYMKTSEFVSIFVDFRRF